MYNQSYNPLEVRVLGRTPEALDQALSKLRRALEKEGIPQLLRDRMYFRSKSRKVYEHMRQLKYKRQLKQEKRKAFERQKAE